MLAWGWVASPNLTTEAYLYLPKGGTTPKGINPFLDLDLESSKAPYFRFINPHNYRLPGAAHKEVQTPNNVPLRASHF